MKTFEEFVDPTLNRIASSGRQDRNTPSSNSSRDMSDALSQRKQVNPTIERMRKQKQRNLETRDRLNNKSN